MNVNQKAEGLKNKESYTTEDLIEIMEILRLPGGCPWDKEQTHKSIRNNFIEEVYEAVEAIDTSDTELLREELGDVLLQVVFHARIAEEAGSFDYNDVTDEICRKLITRHPHIFGISRENEAALLQNEKINANAETSSEVLINWDAIKRSTKNQKNLRQELDGVSRALPALMRASKLSGKAMKAGAFTPLESYADIDGADADSLWEFYGEMLFEMAASAKKNGVDPEEALYKACEKFIEGF